MAGAIIYWLIQLIGFSILWVGIWKLSGPIGNNSIKKWKALLMAVLIWFASLIIVGGLTALASTAMSG